MNCQLHGSNYTHKLFHLIPEHAIVDLFEPIKVRIVFFVLATLNARICLFFSFVVFLEDCQVVLFQSLLNIFFAYLMRIYQFVVNRGLISINSCIVFRYRINILIKLLFLLHQYRSKLPKAFLNNILILFTLITTIFQPVPIHLSNPI